MEPIRLTWLPNWHAYAVRRGDRVLGLIMCRAPLPFTVPAAFA